MAEEVLDNGIRLIRGAGLSVATDDGQTTGAQRLVAVGPGDDAVAQSRRIWMGQVHNEPGMRSVPHHHGEAETAGYILSGHARIFWGEDFQQYCDLVTGDFCYVPPNLPHIEANASDTEPLVFLTCRVPDNIVINLPDVDVTLPGD